MMTSMWQSSRRRAGSGATPTAAGSGSVQRFMQRMTSRRNFKFAQQQQQQQHQEDDDAETATVTSMDDSVIVFVDAPQNHQSLQSCNSFLSSTSTERQTSRAPKRSKRVRWNDAHEELSMSFCFNCQDDAELECSSGWYTAEEYAFFYDTWLKDEAQVLAQAAVVGGPDANNAANAMARRYRRHLESLLRAHDQQGLFFGASTLGSCNDDDDTRELCLPSLLFVGLDSHMSDDMVTDRKARRVFGVQAVLEAQESTPDCDYVRQVSSEVSEASVVLAQARATVALATTFEEAAKQEESTVPPVLVAI